MNKYTFPSLILFLLLFISMPQVQAQITINSSGDASFDEDVTINGSTIIDETLKIGNTTALWYKVAIGCDNSCGTGYSRLGMIINTSGSSGFNHYGISSTASGSASNHYGVLGVANGGSSLNRGIVGAASGSNSYGGYFTSGIYVSGGITQASDERLKQNMRNLSEENISDKIAQLQPLRYEFLKADELRSRGLPPSHTHDGERFGLSAQALEKIFPELVSDVVHALNEDADGVEQTEKDAELITTKAINYQELSVLLLAALQEQQEKIEELEARLSALERNRWE